MINKIVQGISVKLNALYPSAEIYQQDVRQGLVPPAFFINVLNASVSPLSNHRYFMEGNLDILYFPEDAGDNALMQQVGMDLMDELEFITLLDTTVLHGTSMSMEIVDNVLHFMVSYNQPLLKTKGEITEMETQETEINLKE